MFAHLIYRGKERWADVYCLWTLIPMLASLLRDENLPRWIQGQTRIFNADQLLNNKIEEIREEFQLHNIFRFIRIGNTELNAETSWWSLHKVSILNLYANVNRKIIQMKIFEFFIINRKGGLLRRIKIRNVNRFSAEQAKTRKACEYLIILSDGS